MKHTFTFELHPPGLFGLEEPGKTVRPFLSTRMQLEHDTFDRRTGQVVMRGHGTVTRDPAERLDERFQLSGCACWLRDNLLDIEVPAESPSSAAASWETAGQALSAFLLAFSANRGELVRARLVQGVDEDGGRVPHITTMKLADVRIYHLDSLRREVRQAVGQASLQSDARLAESLEKLRLALALDQAAESWFAEAPKFRVAGLSDALASERFLNYFKALTAILGDPSQESHRWQTFYCDLGLEHRRDSLRRMKRIRDDQDVAHPIRQGQNPRVDSQSVEQVRALALEVVQAYCRWLATATSDRCDG